MLLPECCALGFSPRVTCGVCDTTLTLVPMRMVSCRFSFFCCVVLVLLVLVLCHPTDAGLAFHFTAFLSAAAGLFSASIAAKAEGVQLLPLWPALTTSSTRLWSALLAASAVHGLLRQQLATSKAVEVLVTNLLPRATRVVVDGQVPDAEFLVFQGTPALRCVLMCV